MANNKNYWSKPKTPHSNLKSELVLKYFSTWSVVVGGTEKKICYLDLYAGKGENSHGELSTAVKIVQLSNEKNSINQKTIILLNDVKPTYVKNLEMVVTKNQFDTRLKFKPQYSTTKIDIKFADMLSQVRIIPSFCFIDPYGYKGLSQQLIYAVNKDRGCDTLLFFHTTGINRNILEPNSLDDMKLIYGENYLDVIEKVRNSKNNRLDIVLEEFEKSARDVGVKYIIPFRINFKRTKGLSHHLIFMTKHEKGFEIMKDIMHRCSQKVDGISNYTYIEGFENVGEQANLSFQGPMFELKELILKKFNGSNINVGKISNILNEEGYLYVEKNIKGALKFLLKEERVKPIYPNDKKPRKRTLPDWVIICFN